MTLRVFLMMAVLAMLFYVAYDKLGIGGQSEESYDQVTDTFFDEEYDRSHLLPEIGSEDVIHHKYYSLGYDERHEQARWVAYVLNKKELQIPNVPRADRFEKDPLVSTGSAHYYDYRGSGYSRGHMAPAGDMAFSQEAMEESFYMSNMSPQRIPFNGGIWRELEECVRDWAYREEHLYVVTGPILDQTDGRIGDNKVSVPRYFYKAVMDIDGRDQKGIAFIMPNEKSEKPIMDFAVTIDELEERLGFDLYPHLLNDDRQEEAIESQIDKSLWSVNEKRYQKRIKQWNNQ